MYPHFKTNWDHFRKTDRTLTVISDITKDSTFDVGFTYTESDVRKNLNFYNEVSKMHFWNSIGNRNIIWFYAHFRMLNYYLSNPHHEYYWFFDDDVSISDWDAFFSGVERDDSDFISYFIFKNKNVLSQPTVPMIDENTYSNDQWFYRFPGDGDVLPNDTTELFGSFFPIVRFSKRALEKLSEVHREGVYAYSEGFVPTMLNKHGMKLSTLINADNTSRFFDVDDVNIKHKNIRVEWKWI
jgi:hypothetical protein